MSSGNPSKDIRHDPRIQSYPSANNNHNNIERQTSMSVGYLTRTQHNRDRPPYDMSSNFIYTQPPLMQPSNNMPQQQPQPQSQQSPQQHRGSYDRPSSGHSRHTSSIPSTSSSVSSHSTSQQTPRITLPPLSAITENQDAQTEGGAPSGQNSQNVAPSSQHPPPQAQQQQQPQQAQQPQTQQQQQPPRPSPSYAQRPPVQYEPQQGPFPPSQRHLQPSPQLPSDQSRYQSGPAPPQQIPLQPHQMPTAQLQPNPQMGQFPSPSPTPTHFPPQSQYAYPQAQYPPQSMYGQYPSHQMPPGIPPGIPYQPAYATSHRQRPPQFAPYPPPPSGFAPPPPGGPPQGWPPQDYIAQPLTPLTGHSPQQPYSPQLQQMSGPGGPMRIRRMSSGLSQPTYPPPPGEPPQPPSQPQSTLKPKRKRATSGQLRVLNNVFASTFFPSTELRIALGKELNMSPRTVQIWFQNKRQSWRANKAKSEPGNGSTQHRSGGTPSSQTFSASGSFSPHPLRQEQHFAASPSHARMPSSAEESGREEGMENDEGGGWEALRQAQQENRDYRPGVSSGEGDEDGFEDDGINSPHHHHR
jgi:hypothetical protein